MPMNWLNLIMIALPKRIYKLNVIQMKIPTRLFTVTGKTRTHCKIYKELQRPENESCRDYHARFQVTQVQ